jgi:hypothetical protein
MERKDHPRAENGVEQKVTKETKLQDQEGGKSNGRRIGII